jgi:hypothetical protein
LNESQSIYTFFWSCLIFSALLKSAVWFYEYHEVGVPFFVTVSGILPHFGADRVGVGLSAKGDIVASTFATTQAAWRFFYTP